MPKIVDEAEQRRRIRDAARRVFAERGFVSTGLAHVARAARMHRTNLYHYYADKDALIRDLAEELLAEEEALFARALEGEGSPLQRIESVTADVAALFSYWGSTGKLILQLWANEPRRVRQAVRRIRDRLASAIREGQESREISATLAPDAAAAMVVGLLDGVLIQVFLDRKAFADSEGLRKAMCDSVRRILSA
ncbi:MAG: TetR/AcrR family transcriptional regulator [Candidatus Krumholzibacteriia bacterium]